MSILIVYNDGHDHGILPRLKQLLEDKKEGFAAIDRKHIKAHDYSQKKMVIVIGGDGTFLRANHFNKNVPMLGINPHPHTKEGFYMQANMHDFTAKVENALKGHAIKKLLRLSISVNDRLLPELCLNEVFIGDGKPYNMFNYDLIIGKDREFQRSSGVLIGTASGSNAWLKSAGGKVMKMDEQRFQYVSRELYEGRITRDYKLRKGVLEKDDVLELVCKSPGIIVVDSISKEYGLKPGDRVKVSVGKDLDYVS